MLFAFIMSAFLTVNPVSADDILSNQEEQIVENVQSEELDPAHEVVETVSSGDSSESTTVVVTQDPGIALMAEELAEISDQVDLLVELSVEPSVDAYQVSEYYQNYFKGVLQNMPYTDYLCYAERIQSGSSSYSYITHYYLLYDLQIENGQVVSGSYPCLDVYSQDNVYYLDQTTKEFEGYPTIGFASFAPYSALIDRSFDYQALYVGLICVLVFFLVARKTVFS